MKILFGLFISVCFAGPSSDEVISRIRKAFTKNKTRIVIPDREGKKYCREQVMEEIRRYGINVRMERNYKKGYGCTIRWNR